MEKGEIRDRRNWRKEREGRKRGRSRVYGVAGEGREEGGEEVSKVGEK